MRKGGGLFAYLARTYRVGWYAKSVSLQMIDNKEKENTLSLCHTLFAFNAYPLKTILSSFFHPDGLLNGRVFIVLSSLPRNAPRCFGVGKR
jgi:hypothetical protein